MLYDAGPKNKKCLVYCGDDRCDCSANPKYRMLERAIRKSQSQGDARCNFCDGQMPCTCEPPADIDEQIDADMEARAKYSDLLDER